MPTKVSTEYQLITALIKCTNTIGAKETLLALETAADKTKIKIIQFCVKTVLAKLTLTLEDVQPYSYNDQRKVAIGLCVYFIVDVYGIGFNELDKLLPFNLKNRILRTYHSVIQCANKIKPKSDVEHIIVLHFNSLNELFVNHKNSLNKHEKSKAKTIG